MRQAFPFHVAATLLIAAVLLSAFGCSTDGPLDPQDPIAEDSRSAIDLTADLAAATSSGPGHAHALWDTLVFVEPFDTHRNEGNWSYYTLHKNLFETLGGNPDGYLHDENVVSFAPHPGTGLGDESRFTGDYRARRVLSLGIDLRSLDYTWDITSRYVALVVMNDGGTLLNQDDDWGAYILGPDKVPSKYVDMKSAADQNAPGWKSYDFPIPSQAKGLPEGWTIIRPMVGEWDMARMNWVNLMSGVSYAQFWYGDPMLIYFLNDFDLGLDNARIAWEEVE